MSITKACDFLNDKMPEDADIDDALDEYRLTGEQVFKDIQKALSNRKSTSTGLGQFLMNVDADDDDQSNEKENQSTTNGRGSRASKASTSKSTASKAAANKTTASKATPSKASGSGRGRGSTRGRGSASLNSSVRIA